MEIADRWLQDFPQQFRGKKNIEVIVKAFAKQMEEFMVAMEEVNTLTQLDTASGKNLDMIGNILSMSRREATAIIKKQRNTALTDELYRKCLQYQKIKMTTECTYENIIEAISLLWDTDNFSYSEPEDRPATILLEIPEIDADQPDPSIGNVLIPKAAGVSAYYTTGNRIEFQIEEYIELSNLMLRMEIPSFYTKHLDGSFYLDGSEYLNGGMNFKLPTNIGFGAFKAPWTETASAKSVRIAHNEWYLDGEILLDGSKKLDATVIEEDL